MSGRCLEGIRIVCGFWMVSGRCLEGVWKVSGRSQEGVWKMSVGGMEGAWKLSLIRTLTYFLLEGKIPCVWKVSESCFDPILFCIQIFLNQNFFGPKIFLNQTFGPKILVGPNKISDQDFLRLALENGV